jgi:hypothetical protein
MLVIPIPKEMVDKMQLKEKELIEARVTKLEKEWR